MKGTRTHGTVRFAGTLAVAMSAIAWLAGAAFAQPTLELSADRKAYTLGEPVLLSLRVANETAAPVQVRRINDVRTGMLRPQIAKGGGEFRTYVGPQYGVKDAIIPETPLQPGEEFVVPMKVLHNIPSVQEGELPYFFAFDTPGTYRIRVRVAGVIPDQTVTTASIQVEMRAPTGDNAEVWRLLQTEESARLLHSGSPSVDPGVAQGMEQIAESYPGAIYTPAIEASVEGHRAGAGLVARKAPEGHVELREVHGRKLLLQTPSGPSARSSSAADDGQAIVALVQSWTDAYNAHDLAALTQTLVRSHPLRRKWEQGDGDADHAAVTRQIDQSFAASGRLAMDVIAAAVAGNTATAEVIVRAERGQPQPGTRTMTFARDLAGWRIVEVSF